MCPPREQLVARAQELKSALQVERSRSRSVSGTGDGDPAGDGSFGVNGAAAAGDRPVVSVPVLTACTLVLGALELVECVCAGRCVVRRLCGLPGAIGVGDSPLTLAPQCLCVYVCLSVCAAVRSLHAGSPAATASSSTRCSLLGPVRQVARTWTSDRPSSARVCVRGPLLTARQWQAVGCLTSLITMQCHGGQ